MDTPMLHPPPGSPLVCLAPVFPPLFAPEPRGPGFFTRGADDELEGDEYFDDEDDGEFDEDDEDDDDEDFFDDDEDDDEFFDDDDDDEFFDDDEEED